MDVLEKREGVIIYFSRLNGRIRDFPVYFSKTLFEKMKERAKTLHKHIKTNTPPRPEPDGQCLNCPHLHTKCWATWGKQTSKEQRIRLY